MTCSISPASSPSPRSWSAIAIPPWAARPVGQGLWLSSVMRNTVRGCRAPGQIPALLEQGKVSIRTFQHVVRAAQPGPGEIRGKDRRARAGRDLDRECGGSLDMGLHRAGRLGERVAGRVQRVVSTSKPRRRAMPNAAPIRPALAGRKKRIGLVTATPIPAATSTAPTIAASRSAPEAPRASASAVRAAPITAKGWTTARSCTQYSWPWIWKPFNRPPRRRAVSARSRRWQPNRLRRAPAARDASTLSAYAAFDPAIPTPSVSR
nr:hypothetical protein [Marinicauda algicola]